MVQRQDEDWRYAVIEPVGSENVDRGLVVRSRVVSPWNPNRELVMRQLETYQELNPTKVYGIEMLPAKMVRRSRQN